MNPLHQEKVQSKKFTILIIVTKDIHEQHDEDKSQLCKQCKPMAFMQLARGNIIVTFIRVSS